MDIKLFKHSSKHAKIYSLIERVMYKVTKMTYQSPPPPKSNNTALKTIGVVLAVVIILAVFVVALPLLTTAGNNIVQKVNPPNAVVTSTNGRTSVSGLDYIAYVDVSVHNNGGAGTVVVWARVQQGQNEWTKSVSINMGEQDSRDVTLTFSGVSFWSLNDIQYSAWIG
jgi:hypothetical protein